MDLIFSFIPPHHSSSPYIYIFLWISLAWLFLLYLHRRPGKMFRDRRGGSDPTHHSLEPIRLTLKRRGSRADQSHTGNFRVYTPKDEALASSSFDRYSCGRMTFKDPLLNGESYSPASCLQPQVRRTSFMVLSLGPPASSHR